MVRYGKDANVITYGPGSGNYTGGGSTPPPYQATNYTPWGPTTTAASYDNMSPRSKPKKPGLLSGPLQAEQWWDSNKDRMSGPTATNQYYAGLMGRTGGAGLQPAHTSEAFNASKNYFNNPTSAEQWSNQAMGQLQNKSYSESLYEGGGDHLNPFYDRAREKGMKDLERRMASSGMFGSGATARSMYELEGELGAAQARDMAALAGQADASFRGRMGEGRNTAESGTNAMRNRYGDYFSSGQALDTGHRQSEAFNLGAAGSRDTQQRAQDESVFGMSRDVQNLYTDRVTQPLKAKQQLADRYSNIFQSMQGASTDEQARMRENVIQSLVDESGMDVAEAEQMVEEWMQAAGLYLRTQTPTSSAPATPAPNSGYPYPPAGTNYLDPFSRTRS